MLLEQVYQCSESKYPAYSINIDKTGRFIDWFDYIFFYLIGYIKMHLSHSRRIGRFSFLPYKLGIWLNFLYHFVTKCASTSYAFSTGRIHMHMVRKDSGDWRQLSQNVQASKNSAYSPQSTIVLQD